MIFMMTCGGVLFAGAPFIHNFISMQRIYVFALSLLVGGMYSLSALPAHAEFSPTVVFSEINWGGSGRGVADEWFELANRGDAPVDISGWRVTGMATNDGDVTFAEGATIPAGGTYLVANYDVGAESSLLVTANIVTTAVSIPNTRITITLVMQDGTIIDSLTDPGTPDFGSSSAPFASMERDLTTFKWQTAVASSGFDDGAQLGTPGSASTSIVEVEELVAVENAVTNDETEEAGATVPDDAIVVVAVPDVIADEIAETTTVEEVVDFTPEEQEVVDQDVAESEEPIIEPEFTIDPIIEESSDLTVLEPAASDEATAAPALLTEEPNAPVEESGNEGTAAQTATTDVSVATPTAGDMVLNELFVNSEEWIEVRNVDTHDIDVSAWSVRDASGKATSLGAYILAPDALLVIAKPLGKLNNDGDAVELLNASGVVVDNVAYGTDDTPAPDADESLTRTANGWVVTTHVTRGGANPIFTTATETVDDASASTEVVAATITTTYVPPADPSTYIVTADVATTSSAATSTTDPAPAETSVATKTATKKKTTRSKKKTTVTVTSLAGLADDTLVRFTGAVIALPGTFGNQTMVLDGAPIYFYYAQWPTLALGDIVTVEGVVSTARGERRINIASADALVITGHTDVVPVDVVTLDPERVGTVVRVTGTVSARDGDTLTLAIGDNTVRIVAGTHTGITWSTIGSSRVAVVGVMRHLDGEYVVMPRSADDITVETQESIAPAISIPQFPTRSIVGGGILMSTAGILGYWFLRSRTLIPQV